MSHSRSLLAFSVALVTTAASAQLSQTLPAGYDTVSGGSGGTSYPQNSTSNHKWQWHYANSNFAQTAPITITEIYVRAENAGLTVQAFDFPSFTVTCSEALTQYGVGSHSSTFALNLGTNTQLVRTGGWAGGPVPPSGGSAATWIPLGVTTPFVFDPTHGNDFIIQIEKCATTSIWGASLDGKLGATGAVGGNRYGDLSNCAATTSTFSNNEFVPIARIDYVLGGVVTTFCTSGTTSSGCAPSIAGVGTPSASAASAFAINVSNAEGQRQGLVFYGLNNTSFAPVPWGPSTSYLCVKPPTQRSPAQSTGGTILQCDGAVTLDWNAFIAASPSVLGSPLASGQNIYAQAWFKDPPSAKTSTLSNGLSLTLGP